MWKSTTGPPIKTFPHKFNSFSGPGRENSLQSWKKLHAAHAVRADIFSEIEDILVEKSRTYVAIEDLSGDFLYF